MTSSTTAQAPASLAHTASLARAAAQRQNWQEAAALWHQALEQAPGHAPAYLGAANALREAGKHDDAEHILHIAARHFPDHAPIAIARGWTANARRDWPAAIARWQDVCARFPELPQGYNGMAQALRGANRSAELEPFLATAQTRLQTAPDQYLDLQFEIARLRADWAGLRDCAERILARDSSPPVSIYLGLSQAAWHLGDSATAEATAQQALSISPGATEALLILVRITTERGDGEATLALYDKLAALNPNTSAWPLKRVQLLNWLGYLEESLDGAEQLLKRWPNDPMVRVFLRNFGLAAALLPQLETASPSPAYDPDATERRELQTLAERAPAATRPIIAFDPRRDIIIPDATNSSTAVLVFSGTNDAVAMPLPVFDRYLTPLDITPIYLRDFSRLRYLSGIRSLAANYQDTIDALRHLLREKNFTRLCTFGNCAGGFAAIRYGVELGAERIAAFDAPSHCTEGPLARLEQGQNFMRTRLMERYAAETADLKPFLESKHSVTPINLFYQIEDPIKRIHAERLQNIPGVKLHPQPGLGENRLLRRIALSSDNFTQWLADLFAVTPRLP